MTDALLDMAFEGLLGPEDLGTLAGARKAYCGSFAFYQGDTVCHSYIEVEADNLDEAYGKAYRRAAEKYEVGDVSLMMNERPFYLVPGTNGCFSFGSES